MELVHVKPVIYYTEVHSDTLVLPIIANWAVFLNKG